MLSRWPEARPGDLARRCAAVRAPFTGRVTTDPSDLGESLAVVGPGITEEELLEAAAGKVRVLGLMRERGGSGFPSPFTALGVFAAIRALVPGLSGAHVAVQGAGRVGSALVALLLGAGARVTVADRIPGRAAATGAAVVDPDHLLDVAADVFSPNARDVPLTAADVDRLRCRFVAGSMSRQLAGEAAARRLAERGIRHVPEEIAGSGWILNLAAELEPGGYDEGRAREMVLAIEGRVGEEFSC